MSENCPDHGLQTGGNPRYRGICDKWLVGLVFLTLVQTGEALAGDQVTIPGDALKPDFDASSRQRPPLSSSMAEMPTSYQALELPETKTFSTRDFRPHGASILEREPRAEADDAPMIRGTMWQRLAEYRSQGRVRVLTLWEAGGSSVSLLAGKKGEPSLQWTSRLMNRGGAAHGLLDQLFSTSVAGASRGLHIAPHSVNPDPPGKPTKVADIGAGVLK